MKEYACWRNIWLHALGWSHESPHTTNLCKIILRGNYKWHPFTDVERLNFDRIFMKPELWKYK